ncbi:MAG: hypothetical protein VB144_11530 [Clostridia bacterium]|nr:hypothetical protein [Clostridia bacterium]
MTSKFYPFNPALEQLIQTDAPGLDADRAFVAHAQWTGPAAADADAVGLFHLTAASQSITAGLVNPDYARALSVVGNEAGITGDVIITGTDLAGNAITETLALAGKSTKNGAKAFKAVTKIELPAQTHAGTKQVETATIVGAITKAGTVTVTVTSAHYTSDKVMHAAVDLNDDAAAVAGKIRSYIAPLVADHFAVSGAGADVVLTTKVADANDTTLNIAYTNGTCEGLTPDASSTDTTPGSVDDRVSVGITDVLGLPYKLAHDTVLAGYLDNTKDAGVTVTVSATALESNTVDLTSALNGKAVDVYLMV